MKQFHNKVLFISGTIIIASILLLSLMVFNIQSDLKAAREEKIFEELSATSWKFFSEYFYSILSMQDYLQLRINDANEPDFSSLIKMIKKMEIEYLDARIISHIEYVKYDKQGKLNIYQFNKTTNTFTARLANLEEKRFFSKDVLQLQPEKPDTSLYNDSISFIQGNPVIIIPSNKNGKGAWEQLTVVYLNIDYIIAEMLPAIYEKQKEFLEGGKNGYVVCLMQTGKNPSILYSTNEKITNPSTVYNNFYIFEPVSQIQDFPQKKSKNENDISVSQIILNQEQNKSLFELQKGKTWWFAVGYGNDRINIQLLFIEKLNIIFLSFFLAIIMICVALNFYIAIQYSSLAAREKDFTISILHEARDSFSSLIQAAQNHPDKVRLTGEFKKFRNLIEGIERYTKPGSALTANEIFLVNDAVLEVLPVFELTCTAKGIHFIKQIQPGVLLKGSISSFELILENLLSNSLNLCTVGNKISLVIQIKSGMLVILVSDNGKGYNKRYFQKKIIPLIRGRHIRIKHDRKNIVGLHMVYKTVKAFKGTIDFRTAPEKGFEAKVCLPVHSV